MNQLSGARRSAGSKSASVSLSGFSAARRCKSRSSGRLWRSRSQKNRACGSCRSRRKLPDEGALDDRSSVRRASHEGQAVAPRAEELRREPAKSRVNPAHLREAKATVRENEWG